MNPKLPPELLAPAGDMNCALSAFAAGADAVYAGLERFNARERAVSFSLEDYGRLCQFAHANGKKVYLTLNTLLKDSEFSDFAKTVADVLRYRPDAVIVQDLGVLRFFRKYYPEQAVHASTQMGIHNRIGLREAHRLGIKRVILERQIPLTELKQMVTDSPVETEVFVHGALCLSLSGACLLSSWQSGCSGNRGKCKQPCRRLYTSGGQQGYFLSPHDLSLLSRVPELMVLGVSSFKIEGRLRKADYLTAVVSAFRTVLDAPNDPDAMAEAEARLRQACGRPGSLGFLTSESTRNLIRPDSPGVQGERCGKVLSCQNGILRIAVNGNGLRLGDRIRLQGADGGQGTAFTLTCIRLGDREAGTAHPGQTFTTSFSGSVPPETGVYRIGSSQKSMERASAVLPIWREPLDLSLTVTSQGFSAKIIQSPEFEWFFPAELSEAQKRAADPETVSAEFQIAGDPKTAPFRVRTLKIDLAPNLFIPAALLKCARKSFWEAVESSLTPTECNPFLIPLSDFAAESLEKINSPESLPYTAVFDEKGKSKAGEIFVQLLNDAGEGMEALVPFFIPETQITEVKRAIQAAQKRGVRIFRTGSLSSAALVREALGKVPFELRAVFPLPAANRQALRFLAEEHFVSAMLWPELDLSDLTALAESTPLPVEIYAEGSLPLLVTRASVPSGKTFSDPTGNWRVIPPDSQGLTRILSEESLRMPEIAGTSRFIERTVSGKGTASFNLSRPWM